MAARRLAPLVIAVLLSGCSSIDGSYRPACMAYEGDEIELTNGRFTWDRFTDMRQVNESGELVNPFPGFPKSGNYSFVGPQLHLLNDSGESIASFYVHDDTQGKYMLTSKENKQFQHDKSMPECALRRVKQ